MPLIYWLLVAAGLFAGVVQPCTATEIKSVEAYGTEFKVTMNDGTVLRSPELVGAQLVIAIGGRAVRVRIDAVERDPDARLGEVWLHTFSTQAADGA